MTWPTGSVITTDVDASTDSPANARDDILSAIQKLNEIVANGEPVLLGGTQTVAGTKTFSTSPIIPTPSAANHAARKDYVDTAQTAAQAYADNLAVDFAAGGFRNLKLSATGLSATISVTADALMLLNGSGKAKLVSPSLSINSAASGVNGLDTGTLAASTWYAVWVIWNGTTVAGLLSLSTSSPTMPAGYTYKARVGWIRTDGTANKWPLGFVQHGRFVNYNPNLTSNLVQLPVMASGAFGNINTPTWSSISVSTFAPPTACSVQLVANLQVGAMSTLMVGPTAEFGAYNAASNRSPFIASVSSSGGYGQQGWIRLLSTTIWAASDGGGNYLAIYGWEDAI